MEGSGVLAPKGRGRVRFSIRDNTEPCCSFESWLKPCSYSRRVRVKLRSGMGDVAADVATPTDDCPSLAAMGPCEVMDVAAVELRAMRDAEEVVEFVSLLRLYPMGGGDPDRAWPISSSSSSVPARDWAAKALSLSVWRQR